MNTKLDTNGPWGETVRRTEYGLMWQGQLMEGTTFPTRTAVDDYVANAAAHGRDARDYVVVHREVRVNPWWATTPAPATLDAVFGK